MTTGMLRLSELSRLTRYVVIAVLLHVGLLVAIGSIKIVVARDRPPDLALRGDLADFLKPRPAGDPGQPTRIVDTIYPRLPGAVLPAGVEPSRPSVPLPAEARRPQVPAPPGGSFGIPPIGRQTDDLGEILDPDGTGITIGPTIVSADPATALQNIWGIGQDGALGLYRGRFRPKGGTNGPGPGGEDPALGGGSHRAELSVRAALRWLKRNQQPDGSWPMGHSVQAGSALAVLAFLGHGENADSVEFGETFRRGLNYLIGQVQPDGSVTGNMYVQALVGLSLAEAYILTGAPTVREPLEKVLRVILAAQQVPKDNPLHEGGWRYSPSSKDADLSVTGWQILALKSAKTAGLAVPDEALESAADYVWNMYGRPGFGYSGPGASFNMTAVGVLSQQFLGQGADRRLPPALEFLAQHPMDFHQAKGSFILYGWYYATQALYQKRGPVWKAWNKTMQPALLDSQEPDGHWSAPPESNEREFGPVYSTALCALMLEVYYRYLPMYDVVAE